MSIIFLAVAFVGPLALGIWGARSQAAFSDTATDTNGESARRVPWAEVINSAVLYALAYNLTFFLQELFLVIPKAICGLQPILYHNNHRWLVSDPIADLLQGSGALAALISGLVFLGILSRQSKSQGLFKLFSIWMAYQGLAQSLHQFASVMLNPDGDVADALNYLHVATVFRYALAIAALGALVLVGLTLTRPLLRFAPASMHVATPSNRTRFISLIGSLSALGGCSLLSLSGFLPFNRSRDRYWFFSFPCCGPWRMPGASEMCEPSQTHRIKK